MYTLSEKVVLEKEEYDIIIDAAREASPLEVSALKARVDELEAMLDERAAQLDEGERLMQESDNYIKFLEFKTKKQKLTKQMLKDLKRIRGEYRNYATIGIEFCQYMDKLTQEDPIGG